MFYYARAASFNDRPNPIACMQLGVKYLKGFRVTVEADTAAASPAQPMLDKAFEWFKRAAVLQNPIAQHKMGYFYDEGLPGVCGVDIMEAVRWYSQAAELMPDSMHNLAKIYEDGRLFLLGEDGVARDRDAGKRLLTLAAEAGDADAQMVVGMIHATPAFECYNLALSEHWLRLSLAGGKKDAERMLVRVCQQIAQNKQQELERRQRGDPSVDNDGLDDGLGMQEQEQIGKPISLDAAAAKLRGDDFRSHGLLHAAVLEYSRAFELDKQKL
ncbi:esiB, partial [Symbiodinium microadriaticum]